MAGLQNASIDLAGGGGTGFFFGPAPAPVAKPQALQGSSKPVLQPNIGVPGSGTTSYSTPNTQSLLDTTPNYYDNAGNAYSTQAEATAANNNLALYDLAIGNLNTSIDRLPKQLSAATQSIDNQYQTALDQLLGARNQAEGSYNTNKTQSSQDFVTAKNQITGYAGNSLRSLQRLLGSAGAGGSSAFSFLAPEAVGNAAAIQRGTTGQTFGRNQQALDTTWNNYLTGYENSKKDVTAQHDTSEAALRDQFNTENADLLQQLASLTAQRAIQAGGNINDAQPYVDRANRLLDKTGTYVAPKINYNVSAYSAPTLDKYTVGPNDAPIQGSGNVNTDTYTPYLGSLLKDKTRTAFGY